MESQVWVGGAEHRGDRVGLFADGTAHNHDVEGPDRAPVS